jgi:hypothetical protein
VSKPFSLGSVGQLAVGVRVALHAAQFFRASLRR